MGVWGTSPNPLVEKSQDAFARRNVLWSMVTLEEALKSRREANDLPGAVAEIYWRMTAYNCPEKTVDFDADLRDVLDKSIEYLREVRKTL